MITVRKVYTALDKYHYVCDDAGEYRQNLLKACKNGEISQEKMRSEARKNKYMFSANKVELNPNKFKIVS